MTGIQRNSMKIIAVTILTLLFASPAVAFDFPACVNAINKQGGHVGSFDPRLLTRQCVWEMAMASKGGHFFKRCMVRGIRKNVKNVSNPEAFVNRMWSRIHNKCS